MQDSFYEQERLLETVNQEKNEFKKLLDEFENKVKISTAVQNGNFGKEQMGKFK